MEEDRDGYETSQRIKSIMGEFKRLRIRARRQHEEMNGGTAPIRMSIENKPTEVGVRGRR